MRSYRWQEDAACATISAEFFFPDEDNPVAGNYTAAKHICDVCPVAAQCLDYALVNRIGWGMFGGLTPQERVKLLKARRGAA